MPVAPAGDSQLRHRVRPRNHFLFPLPLVERGRGRVLQKVTDNWNSVGTLARAARKDSKELTSIARLALSRGNAGEGQKSEQSRSGFLLDEAFEIARAAGLAQLAQRLGLDLPDSFARDRELLADFLERVVGLLPDPETHP